jgi:hypothetical protein
MRPAMVVLLCHLAITASCVTRRVALHAAATAAGTPLAARAVAYRAEPYSAVGSPGKAKAKCRDIESCREEGERRSADSEARAGPLRNVGPIGANGLGRVRYRAMKETGDGPPLLEGDAADIRFDVVSTGGEYLYSIPSREPGAAAAGVLDTYRLVLGSHDVPIGVEMALAGAHRGDFRRIEVPPDLGFETSNWQPAPTGFSGKQRLERYRRTLTGSGSQPGYAASIIIQVEIMRVRPKSGTG